MLVIKQGVGKGGQGGRLPSTFYEGMAAHPTFLASNDNLLSSAIPLHISVYRTNGII